LSDAFNYAIHSVLSYAIIIYGNAVWLMPGSIERKGIWPYDQHSAVVSPHHVPARSGPDVCFGTDLHSQNALSLGFRNYIYHSLSIVILYFKHSFPVHPDFFH